MMADSPSNKIISHHRIPESVSTHTSELLLGYATSWKYHLHIRIHPENPNILNILIQTTHSQFRYTLISTFCYNIRMLNEH